MNKCIPLNLVGVFAALAAASLSLPGTSHADDTATVQIDFIEDMDEVVVESENVLVDQDEISAMVTYEEGTYVDVPHALSDGIIFATDDGDTLFIDVPGAEYATDALPVANGLAVFEGTDDGANTAVQAMGEDGVRFFTEIVGPDAPMDYNFVVSVPEGGYLEYTPEGGVVIVDANEDPVSIIDPPWAKDALGNEIEVYYTIEDDTIVMTVDHYAAVAYPVIADPWYTKPAQKLLRWGIKKVTKCEVNTSMKDYYQSRGYYCPKYLPWFFCAAPTY